MLNNIKGNIIFASNSLLNLQKFTDKTASKTNGTGENNNFNFDESSWNKGRFMHKGVDYFSSMCAEVCFPQH